MSNIVQLKVVIYEDDVEQKTLTIGYYAGQRYTVKIDTPDGVDLLYEAIASPAAETPD